MLSRKYVTTPVIAAFGVLGISGVLMFFHVKNGGIVTMHEWIGLLFVLFATLHIIVNWKAFSNYFSQKVAVLIMAVVLVTGGGIYIANDVEGANPIKAFVMKTGNAPLVHVAPVVGVSTEDAMAKLEAAGVSVESEEDSLSTIAGMNGRKSMDLLGILLK